MGKTAEHLRQELQPRIPVDRPSGAGRLQEMHERVDHAADHQRHPPGQSFAQRAEQRAPKQNFFQHRHGQGGQGGAEHFLRKSIMTCRHHPLVRGQGNRSYQSQRNKTQCEAVAQSFPLASRIDQSKLTPGILPQSPE